MVVVVSLIDGCVVLDEARIGAGAAVSGLGQSPLSVFRCCYCLVNFWRRVPWLHPCMCFSLLERLPNCPRIKARHSKRNKCAPSVCS
ncbi:hypothetical protein T4D_8629 [Trichinella pseudospiralis]|uniref:Uncharacterized protein n=1 Tax=Trichinella pseudospiralis TaxID=6337 RepID=A0A0V1FBH1_TRIPS|nr:hypothetical protein T4D_8629 [Trichinella pseudospiralis]